MVLSTSVVLGFALVMGMPVATAVQDCSAFFPSSTVTILSPQVAVSAGTLCQALVGNASGLGSFPDATEIVGDEVFTTPGTPGTTVSCAFGFLGEFAAFESELGVTRLGQLNLGLVGTSGFANNALTRPSTQVILRGLGNGNDEPGAVVSVTLDAGASYIFWLVPNSNKNAFLAGGGLQTSNGPYFSIQAANLDSFAGTPPDHLLFLTSSFDPAFTTNPGSGAGIFAWEDLPNLGDRDYGDFVFTTDCALSAKFLKEVDIDIKPGSDPNSINMKSGGTIPVAILSTPDFDATTVDKTSLTFGTTGDENSLAKCTKSNEDVNGDGLDDVVCHFNTQDTGFQEGDTEGILKGLTVDGTPLEGSDSVRILHG